MNTHNPNPNPELYTDINHIDEDKTNNRLSNLEWVTHKQNMNHGTIIKEWESVKQIDNSINWFNKQSFLQMQRMGFCFYKNYLWMTHYKYYEELKCNIESFIKKYKQDTRYDNYCKKIVQVDADGNIVNVWKSVGEASEELKISREAVSKRINGKIKGNDTLFLFAYDYYNSVSQKDIVKCIRKQKEKSQRRSLKIVQLDKNNNFIKEWGQLKVRHQNWEFAHPVFGIV